VRRVRSIALSVLLAVGLLATIPAVTSGQSSPRVPTPKPTPRWLLHAQRHPGSLSGAV
jgi:hypothetical protein